MNLYEIFKFGVDLSTDPNSLYRRGWNDAINRNPRHQFKLAFLFKLFREQQRLYDRGYNDGYNTNLNDSIVQQRRFFIVRNQNS